MLAASGPATEQAATHLQSHGYIFDLKWDGVRCLLVKDAQGVAMLNRKGEDFAYRYPEIVSAAEDQLPYCVLDGEVVIFDNAGKPAFGLTGQRALSPKRAKDIARMAQIRPATFVGFDCLAVEKDIRHLPQNYRLSNLDSVLSKNTERIVKSIRMSDGAAMLRAVKQMGVEGVIAKNPDAPYRAGRLANTWIKMKPTKTVTALVTGWEPGEGWRSDTFGALHLAVLDGSSLVNIGKVGSGFSVADLATLDAFVKGGHELLVEVEYLERQPGTGVLRFPVYRGVRFDLDREAASVTQFA